MEQMNLLKPDKDLEDYIKNIGGRDVYENRMAGLPNETRITMLLLNFNKSGHDLYLAYLLLFSPKDLTFEETIGERFTYVNLAIREGEGIRKYTGISNRMSNAFSYGWLKEGQFRYLVFIQGLRSPCYAEIRLKKFSLLDKNPDITPRHHPAHEYNNFRSLIVGSNMVESNETRICQKIRNYFYVIDICLAQC
ncbi:unnamed protein product [Hymenolepis diminuta]|uniref:Uncharacterized protein n=1 Tax=Hymenolepis diminuta TaxID=6216 RepID=A0A564YQQ6_HYMDI|nr:unnamed protein product [Hymenolepis diminuta]